MIDVPCGEAFAAPIAVAGVKYEVSVRPYCADAPFSGNPYNRYLAIFLRPNSKKLPNLSAKAPFTSRKDMEHPAPVLTFRTQGKEVCQTQYGDGLREYFKDCTPEHVSSATPALEEAVRRYVASQTYKRELSQGPKGQLR